jgi:hypothetical protein
VEGEEVPHEHVECLADEISLGEEVEAQTHSRRSRGEVESMVQEVKDDHERNPRHLKHAEELLQSVKLRQLLAVLVLGDLPLADTGRLGESRLAPAPELAEDFEGETDFLEHSGSIGARNMPDFPYLIEPL